MIKMYDKNLIKIFMKILPLSHFTQNIFQKTIFTPLLGKLVFFNAVFVLKQIAKVKYNLEKLKN